MVVFPAITLSQPNYSYGCFVVEVVVVVWLDYICCPNIDHYFLKFAQHEGQIN